MTIRPSSASRSCLSGKISRLVPVIALAGLCWSSSAFAAPIDGQNALNAKLANFNTQATQPGTTAKAPKNTFTATSDELISALIAVFTDPADNPNNVSVQDLVAGAFLQTGGKARGDRNKIAGSIVDGVLGATNFDLSNTAAIVSVVNAALSTGNDGNNLAKGPLELDDKARAAVVASALKRASSDAAGASIASASIGFIASNDPTKSDKALAAFATSAIGGVGNGTGRIASFVDGLFGTGGFTSSVSRQQRTIDLAVSVKTNPVASGEVVGSFTQNKDDNTNVGVVQTIIQGGKLDVAISEITAAASRNLTTLTPTQFAQNVVSSLIPAKQTAAIQGYVAGGVIRAADDNTQTNNVINGVLGTAAGQSFVKDDKTRIAFAAAALHSNGTNGADIALETTKAGTIAANIGAKITGATQKGELGKAMVTAVLTYNPDATSAITSGILGTGGVTDTTSFGITLVKAAKTNNTAAGGVAGAIASTLVPSGTDAQKLSVRADLASALIKANGGVAAGVANQVALTLNNPTGFAQTLALKQRGKSSDIAVGVSWASPASADSIVKSVVLVKDPLKALPSYPFKGIAKDIAGKVARAVSVEKAADIGTQLAQNMNLTGSTDFNTNQTFLAVKDAPMIAAALAKAINDKPAKPAPLDRPEQVTTHNRADELGELAASMVGGILSVLNTSNDIKFIQKTIADIGKSVIGVLSKSNIFNDLNKPADYREAADVIGSIAQVISVHGTLSFANKQALLGNANLGVPSALETALVKLAGKYASDATTAFHEVRELFNQFATSGNSTNLSQIVPGSEAISNGVIQTTGKYEIGSVNDPETPVTNY